MFLFKNAFAASRWALAVAMALTCAEAAAAQGTTVSGQLYHSVTLKPVAGATVLVEGTRLETTSAEDGTYAISNVPPGSYHLLAVAAGFMPARAELRVAGAPLTVDLAVDPELHYTEVVSVSPEARSQFESYQPTTVLAGQDLSRELQGTIGATLAVQPGVAERSLGPGPSRPVIRGLDGDRVLILEDGQRTGDLSSQSGDHGVTLNPASASRIEVVRGPATLLYGANAIGGLVNVISNTIPTERVDGASGGLTFDLGSASAEAGGAADVLWGKNGWAVRASGSGRRSGDAETPEGTVANTQSRTGSGSLGVAWTGSRGYFGGSYGYDDIRYGVPFIEGGQIQLTPRRHMVGVRTGAGDLRGPIDSVRVLLGVRQYRHEELEGTEVHTRFENDTLDFNLHARQRRAGRLTGTVGAAAFARDFRAIGQEALSPAVAERSYAVFAYEELTWPHLTLQFGGRLNHASFSPEGGLPPRTFTDASGSVGLLVRPAAANDRFTVAFSLARASRNPALEELYFFGPHAGNFAFEIGNPDVGSERALGFDASLRWRSRRVSAEVTYFRNSIDDYIFRNPISEEEFDERFGHELDEEEHEGEDEGEHGHEEGELPIVEFIAADSLLQGLETHVDIELSSSLVVEAGFDLVRGTLRGGGRPLSRIPPARFRGGLRYRMGAFQAGGEIVAAARQARVFGEETPTDGYYLLKLFGAYSFGTERLVHTITARIDNATNELHRNHLSLIKDFVPEMGRNVKVIYSIGF